MTRSIKELGDSQRCPKCNEFGEIADLKVEADKSVITYLCKTCMRNFKNKYTSEEIVSMANGFLIDDKKYIHDFQKKYAIATGEFLNLKDGLDGAFFSNNKEAIMENGKKLLSKCGEFYKMEYKGSKKENLFFNLSCENCGRKKLKIQRGAFFTLGTAGIISTSTVSIVKEELESDEMVWDASEAYGAPSTLYSADARARLGMDDDEIIDELEGLTCKKCGAGIQIEMKKYGKCPTCGSPLSV
jgi:Zn finger protein HypA/HybF involved in hydrogenase expression